MEKPEGELESLDKLGERLATLGNPRCEMASHSRLITALQRFVSWAQHLDDVAGACPACGEEGECPDTCVVEEAAEAIRTA